MKKTNFLIILAIIFSFSCTSVNYWKVKLELPGISPVNLDEFKELLITNFFIEKETKDFNLNKELVDYFSAELGNFYKGKINSREITPEKKDMFKEADFWKNLIPGVKETLFLTGTSEYSKEVRKAILEKSQRSDDFTSSKKGLAERKFYTLILHLYLIDAHTGKILYDKDFKETRGYENPRQTAHFAFFDLVQQAQVKFFRNILGIERVEQRYLISD